MTSIRRRTSLLVAATVTVIIIAGALALSLIVRSALVAQFDDGLAARAGALQSLTRLEHGHVEIDLAADALPRYQPGPDAEYFIAWTRTPAGWQPLARSESLTNQPWPLHPATLSTTRATDITLPTGARGRLLTLDIRPAADPEDPPPSASSYLDPQVRLVVAQSRRALDSALLIVNASIAGVGLALIFAAAIGASWAVSRGLGPLGTLGSRVAALTPESPAQRITSSDLPPELAPIADRLNEALSRFDAAFQRERRFTAAASHELRTPLAEVRMLLEVALGKDRTPERWKDTAAETLEVVIRAEELLAALLTIARGDTPPADQAADLAEIVTREVARRADTARAAGITLTLDTPATLPIRTPEAAAQAVVVNLLDNALRHGHRAPSAAIDTRVTRSDGCAHLTITNAAPNLDPSDLPHLFEPFWRKDPARARSGGCGLGLAVCRTLIQSASGTIDAGLDHAHRLVIRASWPESPPPAAAAPSPKPAVCAPAAAPHAAV